MKAKTIHYILDVNHPPPLTSEQKIRVEALKNMPDSEIDVSDIPPLDEKFWDNAVRNPFYKPIKFE